MQLHLCVWRPNRPMIRYFKYFAVTLMVLLGTYVIVSVYTGKADDEKHILPNGFTGPVLIVFNQRGGVDVPIEDGIRIYRIPKSGKLVTSLPPNYGWGFFSYYYENGVSIPQAEPGESSNRSDTGVQIWGVQVGVAGVLDRDNYSFKSYTVGRLKDIDSLAKVGEKILFEHKPYSSPRSP